MNTQISLVPLPSNSDHSNPTDNSENTTKRIRAPREDTPTVPKSPGGWEPIPTVLHELVRKKLQGSHNTVFWFVWYKTIRHNKTSDSIPMVQFTNALPDSAKTIQRRIDWLKENDWLIVEEYPGKMSVFSIPEWILSLCYPEEIQETNPGQIDRGNPGQIDRDHKTYDQKTKKTKKTSLSSLTPGSISIEEGEPISKTNDYDVSSCHTDKEIEEWVERIGGGVLDPKNQVRGLLTCCRNYWHMDKKGAEYLIGIGRVDLIAEIERRIRGILDCGKISERENAAGYLVQCVKNELLDNAVEEESQAGGEGEL